MLREFGAYLPDYKRDMVITLIYGIRVREEKLSKQRIYTREVADAVLRKVKEIEFRAARDPHEAFERNNLPTFVKNDTVVLMRETLIRFHNDFALMTAFLAHHFRTEKVGPTHLTSPLLNDMRDDS